MMIKYGEIERVTQMLIAELRKVDNESPYTIYATIWDDGDFSLVLQSVSFDMPQCEAVRLKEYMQHIKKFYYRTGGNIEFEEYSKLKKNENIN